MQTRRPMSKLPLECSLGTLLRIYLARAVVIHSVWFVSGILIAILIGALILSKTLFVVVFTIVVLVIFLPATFLIVLRIRGISPRLSSPAFALLLLLLLIPIRAHAFACSCAGE